MSKFIGLDFGGVIVKPSDEAILFRSELGMTISQPEAFQSIKALVENFNGNVYIISKASKGTENEIRKWLALTKFHSLTGFNQANIFFCDKREKKLPIALKLGITHFIDDNLSVLEILKGSVPNLYHFGVNNTKEFYVPLLNWQVTMQKLITN